MIVDYDFFKNVKIRFTTNRIWFVAKDIAEALGYSCASKMCKKIDMDNKKLEFVYDNYSSGSRKMLLISQYAVLKLSEYTEFNDWIGTEFDDGSVPATNTIKDVVYDCESALKLIKAIVKVGNKLDVPKDILFSESVKLAKNLTGIDFTDTLKLSPYYNEFYHNS